MRLLAPSPGLSYRLGVESQTRQELEATVAARRELGPAHDDELIAGFLDRIEKEIDKRVDRRLAERGPHRATVKPEQLGIAVPLIIVAGIFGGAWGIAAVAAALAIIFVTITASNR